MRGPIGGPGPDRPGGRGPKGPPGPGPMLFGGSGGGPQGPGVDEPEFPAGLPM